MFPRVSGRDMTNDLKTALRQSLWLEAERRGQLTLPSYGCAGALAAIVEHIHRFGDIRRRNVLVRLAEERLHALYKVTGDDYFTRFDRKRGEESREEGPEEPQ